MPLVSVIVPTLNRAGMLEKAVQSVFGQTFKDYELIVVDDGSRDRTGEVMERYSGRLKYLARENGGVSSARNAGIGMANGELVAWLDDDDFFFPGKLEKQVVYFRRNPRVGLVYTGHVTIDSTSSQVRKSYYVPPEYRDCESGRKMLQSQCYFANSTVMMKRECFDRAGGFDEGLSHSVDYDMWLRVAAFYRFGCVPEVLAGYRWHGRQISMRRNNRIMPLLRERARNLYAEHPCREVE